MSPELKAKFHEHVDTKSLGQYRQVVEATMAVVARSPEQLDFYKKQHAVVSSEVVRSAPRMGQGEATLEVLRRLAACWEEECIAKIDRDTSSPEEMELFAAIEAGGEATTSMIVKEESPFPEGQSVEFVDL